MLKKVLIITGAILAIVIALASYQVKNDADNRAVIKKESNMLLDELNRQKNAELGRQINLSNKINQNSKKANAIAGGSLEAAKNKKPIFPTVSPSAGQ
jgi:hypothetical protein